MQLKKIKGPMSVAACTLMQAGATSVQAAERDWDIDTAILFYSESDGRVSAVEPAIRAAIDLGDDEFFNFQVVVDALTGATPNGAHKSSVVQTFTNPSGNGGYTVQPGELPLSKTFRDTRVALTAEWDKPLDRLSRVLMAATVSGEVDYTSIGLSSTYSHDINDKNTTLQAGLALTFDTINPIGSIPKGLNPMRKAGSNQQRLGGSDTKTAYDIMFGVTQIIDRRTFVQANYTYSTSAGYHNDYNNVLTVIDPLTGQPLSGSWLGANDLPYLFENRPDKRSRNILFLRGVHHLEEDVIHLSYRYFTDDWGISSHTLDFKYRYDMGGSYLQPHLRYYTQSAADFYRHDLVQGTDIDATGKVKVQYASHDYRLADSVTTTYGLKYGYLLGDASEFSVRAEVMNQSLGNDGALPGEETPDLSALILQINYSLVW